MDPEDLGAAATAAGLRVGKANMYMVMRGSCINFSIASSNGLFPLMSGLTDAMSLANIVHIALSAATSC